MLENDKPHYGEMTVLQYSVIFMMTFHPRAPLVTQSPCVDSMGNIGDSILVQITKYNVNNVMKLFLGSKCSELKKKFYFTELYFSLP